MIYDIYTCAVCYPGFSAPFTIQRIAELVVEPKKYYKRTDKYIRGLEKVVCLIFRLPEPGYLRVKRV